MGNRNKL